jgi:hypothetical protein
MARNTLTDIAFAYMTVARVNHYLVTVDTSMFTDERLEIARQELITRENVRKTAQVSLALDLIEREQERRTVAASRGKAA